jgi:hypothetical protein
MLLPLIDCTVPTGRTAALCAACPASAANTRVAATPAKLMPASNATVTAEQFQCLIAAIKSNPQNEMYLGMYSG